MTVNKHLTALSLCILACVIFALIQAASAQQYDKATHEFVFAEISRLKKQILFYERNEEEAFQILNKTRQILALAREKNNVNAERKALETIADAEKTLTNIGGYKKRDTMRLAAMEDALGWRHMNRAFGAPALIRGEVFKKTRSGLAQYDGRSPVMEGDVLVAGKDGFLEVALPDNTRLCLGSDTEMEVQKLDDRSTGSAYIFLKGKLHVMAMCWKLYGPDRCRQILYRHPSSGVAIAVRGTEFTLNQNPDESLVLSVLEGVVEVTGHKGDTPFKINANEELTIEKDGTMKVPIPLKAEQVQRWWEE